MISTKDCVAAIVALAKSNPDDIINQFVDGDVDVVPAQNPKNWKRLSKEKHEQGTLRGFDCRPYDDQLRAYVIDDGTKIISVEICGE